MEKTGNLIEAGLWAIFFVVLGIRAFLAAGRLRAIQAILALAFLAFGVSDVIESHTGAWWRPIWLLVLKAACVAVFVFGFRAYYRESRKGG